MSILDPFLSLSRRLQQTGNTVLLHVAYYAGVGPTSLVGKAFGKQFLQTASTSSTWVPCPGEQDMKEMF